MQPKRPRINPLIFALALAAVLMIWSVFTSGTGMSGGSTMSYSTVVHYFEHNQVTKFTLDRNTSVITLTLKEGDLIVTSNSVGIFPQGYLIGSVQSIEPMDSGLSYCAILKPSVDLASLTNVIVITDFAGKEQKDAEN